MPNSDGGKRDRCANCGYEVGSVASEECPYCGYDPLLRVTWDEFLEFTQHRNDPANEEATRRALASKSCLGFVFGVCAVSAWLLLAE